MIQNLIDKLNETTIPFVYMAWSHSPDSEYGVVTTSDQRELSADEDAVCEKMLEGYVDVFTYDTGSFPMVEVEGVLREMGLWFTLNSIQYEDDTGFIHYEWEWRDTNGSATWVEPER